MWKLNKKQKRILVRVLISLLLAIGSIFLKSDIKNVVIITAYLIASYDILFKGFRNLSNIKNLDENFLMTVATFGAIFLTEYYEALFVVLFYQVGELFQSVAVKQSRDSIKKLMDLKPDKVKILNNNEIVEVSPEELNIGDIYICLPGERLAIDGEIVNGLSSLDTSKITGESMVLDVNVGDKVISGSINLSNTLQVKTTTTSKESTASKIIDLVENSATNKSKSEKFISRFSKVYTPIVVLSSILLTLIPVLLGYDLNTWLNRSLVFLVVSCPCALVISVPLSFFSAIGGTSKKGILIKGANSIEEFSNANHIVFDKTGTITSGNFEVVDYTSEEVLELAAILESNSSHPIAKTIVEKYNKNFNQSIVNNFENLSGYGVKATIYDKDVIYVGSEKLLEKLSITIPTHLKNSKYVHVIKNNEYLGNISIRDKIKENAKEVIENLHKLGFKTTILSGDNKDIVTEVARNLNIDNYYGELLPNEKIDKILEVKKNGVVAFVGDGINDAPVMLNSDIAISMGMIGSDASIEASSIVLMDDNLSKLITLKKISRKTMRIVKQNIFFALGIKLLILLLASFGLSDILEAIFADVGVSILCILNAMRLLK